MSAISGSCLCKGVQYHIPSRSFQWLRCHCSMCRKAIGAEHCTYLAVPLAKVQFKSRDTLKTFKSSEFADRSFCSTCGCSVAMRYDCQPQHIWFSAATLDVPPPVANPHQIFTTEKAPFLDAMTKAPTLLPYQPGWTTLPWITNAPQSEKK